MKRKAPHYNGNSVSQFDGERGEISLDTIANWRCQSSTIPEQRFDSLPGALQATRWLRASRRYAWFGG